MDLTIVEYEKRREYTGQEFINYGYIIIIFFLGGVSLNYFIELFVFILQSIYFHSNDELNGQGPQKNNKK